MGSRANDRAAGTAVTSVLAALLVGSTMALAASAAPAAAQDQTATGSMFVITDSVVLGAVDELDDLVSAPYAFTGFPGFHLSAAPQTLRNRGATAYDTVVVAVGNNENTPIATMRRRIVAIMEVLRDVEQVIWVRPRHWSSQMVRFNSALTEVHLKWANLELADWQSASAGHGEYFYRDGIHLRPEGQDAIADLIFGHYDGSIEPDRAARGALDSVTSLSTGLRLGGWVIDPDTNDSVNVRFTLDGRVVADLPANSSRPDVDAIWNHGPNHGFAYTLPRVRDGNYDVCALAQNLADGSYQPVGCKPVTIANSPIGELERIRTVRGRIQVQGWAYDPNSVATGGHVWIRVQGNKRRFVNNLATKPRPDIDALEVLPGTDHGFRFTIPIPDHIALDAQFCVFAIDPHKNRNTKLGCLG